MKDPYEVLGVPRGASKDRVKAAYRELAKKYHPDNYSGTPLADLANEKMQEINEAYDSIMSGKADSGSHYSSGSYGAYNFSSIEELIRQGRLDEAERLLETVPTDSRSAHWYYLKGQVNEMRGWTQQAYSYYSMASNMEPGNDFYRRAYEKMNNNRAGGFKTQTNTSAGCCDCCDCGNCSGCDICSGLMCADCCCECMGGDLISCC